MMIRTKPVTVALAVLLGAGAVAVAGQQFRGGYDACAYDIARCERAPYDGRFTFLRVYFDAGSGLGGFGGFGRGREPAWHHDKPNAERNLSSILREITTMRTFDGASGGNAMSLTDPELFRYPILWMAEPGVWQPTTDEVNALREHLLKGGFIIFDDFTGQRDWQNFAYQMKRVLPDLEPVVLNGDEPVFRAFFDITPEDLRLQLRSQPIYLGIFEDNDPTKRQIAMINFNNDVGEFMDYEPTGFLPVGSNEAYRLGVNYIVYAMTH